MNVQILFFLDGEASFAGAERIFQQIQQKDEETKSQLKMIQQIQVIFVPIKNIMTISNSFTGGT